MKLCQVLSQFSCALLLLIALFLQKASCSAWQDIPVDDPSLITAINAVKEQIEPKPFQYNVTSAQGIPRSHSNTYPKYKANLQITIESVHCLKKICEVQILDGHFYGQGYKLLKNTCEPVSA